MADYTQAQGLLNSGNLQGGYNALRDQGMNDQGITDWYNKSYGSQISASDVTAKFGGGYQAPAQTPAPAPVTAPQPYRISPSGKFDINGNALALKDGQVLGGSMFANSIMNANGTSEGQYYDSAADAALWRQRSADSANSTAVIGPGPAKPATNLKSSFESAVNSGGKLGLQSGYNTLKNSGMNDQQITDWYNQTYGDKISVGDVTAKFGGGYQAPATGGLLSTPTTGTASATAQNQFTVPNLNQGVDYNTMTIEGRMQQLLAANGPVIRQAGDKARAAFAERGLRNSSMAEQAALEAMTTMAVQIAGPDAAAYLKQSQLNQTETNDTAQESAAYERDLNKLTVAHGDNVDLARVNNDLKVAGVKDETITKLQTNYQSAVEGIRQNYASAITNIQIQDMDSEQKTAQIDAYYATMQTQLNLTNASFANMPGWVQAWAVEMEALPAAPVTTPTPAPTPTTPTAPPFEGGG